MTRPTPAQQRVLRKSVRAPVMIWGAFSGIRGGDRPGEPALRSPAHRRDVHRQGLADAGRGVQPVCPDGQGARGATEAEAR